MVPWGSATGSAAAVPSGVGGDGSRPGRSIRMAIVACGRQCVRSSILHIVVYRGRCVDVVAMAGVITQMTIRAGPVRLILAERRVVAIGARCIVHPGQGFKVGVAYAIGPCDVIAVAGDTT